MNITNGRRANCSYPLPIWWYFIIFILLNVLYVSTFVFSAYPHVTTMRVSLQFIWLLKLKQDIVEQVQITLLKYDKIAKKNTPKTPCQAKLTIATVHGPESKHLWFLQWFVMHVFIQLRPIHFFCLYYLRKYPINLDHRHQPHPFFNHWEYTFQDKQSQFKTVPTPLLVCAWLCHRLCC